MLCGHTEHKSPTHPPRCLLVHSVQPNRGAGGGEKNVPASSTFPQHSSQLLRHPPTPPPYPLLFDFCTSPLALSLFTPCSPLLLQPFFCFQASTASRPLDSVSKQFGRKNECKAGAGAGAAWCVCVGGLVGDETRLLLLVTQTWLGANTSTMFMLPHSLPPTE